MFVIVALLAAVAGCSREQFRQRADRDVEGVISQKNLFPEWKIENWHAYVDPRARFADPNDRVVRRPRGHAEYPP